jgi:predicted nucleic acid-binding protein
MAIPLLDTNVILRHLLGDHPEQSPRATAYLRQVEQGQVRVRTSELVVFEAVFTLERHYRLPKKRVPDSLLPLLELPGIVLPGKQRLREAFDLYVQLNLPFADAYHAALMRRLGAEEMVSFDREFDRIPDIRRVEP